MKLIDITKGNWLDVVFLTTNQKVTIQRNREPYDVSGMPTLCKDFVVRKLRVHFYTPFGVLYGIVV